MLSLGVTGTSVYKSDKACRQSVNALLARRYCARPSPKQRHVQPRCSNPINSPATNLTQDLRNRKNKVTGQVTLPTPCLRVGARGERVGPRSDLERRFLVQARPAVGTSSPRTQASLLSEIWELIVAASAISAGVRVHRLNMSCRERRFRLCQTTNTGGSGAHHARTLSRREHARQVPGPTRTGSRNPAEVLVLWSSRDPLRLDSRGSRRKNCASSV